MSGLTVHKVFVNFDSLQINDMKESITYEECHETDFDTLLAMSSKLFKDSDGAELKMMIEQSFASNHIKVLVAKASDQAILGFAIVSIRRDYVEGAEKSPTGYLEAIYVESDYRKEGIAKHLVATGEKWLKENNCTQIGSDTWLTDTRSRKFHQSIGFWEEDELVHFLKNID